MTRYKIYQIKDIENTFYAFRGYDPKKFKFEDYELRYEGEFEFIDKKLILSFVKLFSIYLICEDLQTSRDIHYQ